MSCASSSVFTVSSRLFRAFSFSSARRESLPLSASSAAALSAALFSAPEISALILRISSRNSFSTSLFSWALKGLLHTGHFAPIFSTLSSASALECNRFLCTASFSRALEVFSRAALSSFSFALIFSSNSLSAFSRAAFIEPSFSGSTVFIFSLSFAFSPSSASILERALMSLSSRSFFSLHLISRPFTAASFSAIFSPHFFASAFFSPASFSFSEIFLLCSSSCSGLNFFPCSMRTPFISSATFLTLFARLTELALTFSYLSRPKSSSNFSFLCEGLSLRKKSNWSCSA